MASNTNAQAIKLTKDMTPFATGDVVLLTDKELELLTQRAKRNGVENWYEKQGKRVHTDREPLDGFEALRNDEEANSNPDNVIADTDDGEVVADTSEQSKDSSDEETDLGAEAEKAKQARADAKAKKAAEKANESK